MGQISAPNSLKNCLAEISLHPAEFKVQSFLCIASMSLIVIMWIVSGLTLRAYGDIVSV